MFYEFDPTGTLEKNKITDEIFYISPGRELQEASLLVPKCTPFFKESFELWTGPNKTGNKLVLGEDYVFIEDYEKLSEIVGKDVYYCLWINNKYLTKSLYGHYQTVGGNYVFNANAAMVRISAMLTNVFKFSWNEIVNKPTTFPPRKHIHDETNEPMPTFVNNLKASVNKVLSAFN